MRTIAEEGKGLDALASRYLTIYVGQSDWNRHIANLANRLVRKHGEQAAKDLLRKAISFAIILPAFDRSTRIDPDHPENLLFWGMKYDQFPQKDWFKELRKIIGRDILVQQWQEQALTLGVIDPIDYQPYCRQAYLWLCQRAEDTGALTSTDTVVKKQFQTLVWVYGGVVVSNMFTHYDALLKKKVINWRSGYFFQRAIFDVYSIEQVLRIKKTELDKTNDKLIKTVRNKKETNNGKQAFTF